MRGIALPAGARRGVCHLLLLSAICIVIPVTAAAQGADRYLLAPDDVLAVSVLRHPELSAPTITVAPDGTIALPVVGRLKVSGMTVAEVEEAVTAGLRRRLVNPEVTVVLQARRASYAFALGDVQAPGAYQIGDGWGVAQLVASAGGLVGDAAAMSATLFRAEGERVEIDLARLLSDDAGQAAIALRPGDVLEVRRRTIQVTVAGGVATPGTYEIPAAANLVDAIAFAGGLLDTASLSRITIERRTGELEQHNLAPVLLDGRAIPRVTLHSGDTIVVPRSTASVAAWGEVAQPGSFPFDEDAGMRVSRLIALAGGITADLQHADARLFRDDGTVVPLDLQALLVEGDRDADPPLRANDAVSVTVDTIEVQVSGQVEQPGSYEMAPTSGVLTALTMAGGLGERAAAGRIRVRHADGSTETVNLVGALTGGDLAGDVKVLDGDLIVVPEATAQVAVIGAVASPGYYDLDEERGATVTQMIAEAGGPQEEAEVAQVGVLRRTPEGPTRIDVDLRAVLGRGELDRDVALQDRDVIFVPPDRGTDWNMIMRAVSSVALLGRWLVD